jgi:hypothetical protein
MLLEGEAGTGAALNGEATAAAMGATPMVDRTGIMDEAATAEERTARTNATPSPFPPPIATSWASTPPWPETAVHDCPVLSASSLG